jgi:DNA-binding PadR family transcriptional regulator
LQRLERSGLVRGSWTASDSNRRARYYALTAAGRRRLAAGRRDWEENVAAVARVLRAGSEHE